MSMSNALRCVPNGRAAAPPWINCSVGVSTSKKPSRCRVSRIERVIVPRVRTIARASSRTTRSAYRCRTRASSERSLCKVGSGRSDFDASAQSVAMMDNSPRLEAMTRPVTET